MTEVQKFSNLHHQENYLLIANVWNPQCAIAFEKLGYQAIGTSSAAVAESLGYPDGQIIPFQVYLYIIKRIKAVCKLPFTVDIEAGYGATVDEIVDNITCLADMGIAGINIEDSEEVNGKRGILPAEVFAETLRVIVQKLAAKNKKLFINLRTDTYLLNIENKKEETVTRIKTYEAAGADGIFVPCLTNLEDMKTFAAATHLPVSIMCMPDLADFTEIQNTGIKRISMGPFLYRNITNYLELQAVKIKEKESFKSLFS